MKVYGLIGYPLGHSFSKDYFTKKILKESITDSVFELFSISTIEQLKSLEYVIPCKHCRKEWNESLQFLDKLDLNISMSLFKWSWEEHNKVNKKLGVTCAPSFKEVVEKYESFRSRCTKSPDIIEKEIKKGKVIWSPYRFCQKDSDCFPGCKRGFCWKTQSTWPPQIQTHTTCTSSNDCLNETILQSFQDYMETRIN